MLDLPVWFEIGSFVFLGLLLLGDLLIVARRPHLPSMKESTVWVIFYVGLALLFGLAMLAFAGGQAAGEFYAGWLTEYSLSVDNLFVFVIIMARFSVPRDYQQKVLMVGIIIALVLRGIFILAGAALIVRFSWLFYIFGAFLIYTAIKLAKQQGEEEEFEENALIRRMRKVLPISEDYDGAKVHTTVDGKRMWTPMIIVFLAIGSTDLLFALDSIPAIFGLTREAFIVFTANIFALMGLRQLYFLLGGLLERLIYLSLGLSAILGFIGIKLILEAMHENSLPFINGGEPIEWAPTIPIWLSLTVIIGVMALAVVASLLKARNDPEAAAQLRGGDADPEDVAIKEPGDLTGPPAETDVREAEISESGDPLRRSGADEGSAGSAR
ncbi:MAG: TerC family protein [Geodermatophilaceae bacterium]|nr:TerC family protein [Geodermatophilaceae bacterium]